MKVAAQMGWQGWCATFPGVGPVCLKEVVSTPPSSINTPLMLQVIGSKLPHYDKPSEICDDLLSIKNQNVITLSLASEKLCAILGTLTCHIYTLWG